MGRWSVRIPFIHSRKGAILGLFFFSLFGLLFSVAFSLVSDILFFVLSFYAQKFSSPGALLNNHSRSF